MTTSSEPAVLWNGNKPSWNLTATTAYPVVLPQKGKDLNVYVYLTPYEPGELKAILQKAVSGYKREKRDIEIVREDRDAYTPLLDKHFVKLGNATGTPDDQRAFLDKNPELKAPIAEYTFGGLTMDPSREQADDDLFDISVELSGQVNVYQDLYDEANDKIVRMDMVHSHAHPTESQFREYRSARRSKFLRKAALWTIAEQHNTLEKLYDAVIRSISGAAANGKPCDAATKADWIGSIPLWHKLWIVDQIFGDLVEKNG